MYPRHIHLYYNIPSSQDSSFQPDYYSTIDPRQMGGFQPPTAPPPGHHGPTAPAPGHHAPPQGHHGPTAPPPGHHAPPQGHHGPTAPPPGHHDPETGPPTSPPPSVLPQQTHQAGTFAVDPGSMVRCLHRFTYVWLRGFEQFWFYPTFIGRHSVSGWRWTGRRWVNFGISLRQIQSFTCV